MLIVHCEWQLNTNRFVFGAHYKNLKKIYKMLTSNCIKVVIYLKQS